MTSRQDIMDGLNSMINVLDIWSYEDVTASEFDCLEDIAISMQRLIYMMGGE